MAEDASRRKKSLSVDRLNELTEFAIRVAKARARRERDLLPLAEDIANKALESLVRAMRTQEIHNEEGFLTWKIKRLVIDAGISRNAAEGHLKMLEGGLPRKPSLRGLSVDVIDREERQMLNLRAAAIKAVMPDPADRALLDDRFYRPDLTITDLARRHGGKSPNAMANYLKKILGDERTPGAAECVSDVVGRLSLSTARVFVRLLVDYDDLDVVSDPFAAAVGHLEFMATRSPGYKRAATHGIARLRWLERNRPNNRGLTNKLLNRLIRTTCFYVLEVHDARHDRFDDLGLVDDIHVLDAVYRAVRRFSAT
jgi:hypothetical protein